MQNAECKMQNERRLIDAYKLEDLVRSNSARYHHVDDVIAAIAGQPTVDAVEVPETGVGDISDGYHTFNQLYYQRMVLFAALVKANKDRAWKSYRHEDGELCFGGGWFIVGIDTPEGSYTYHYENKDFDLFDCVELPAGKHWDGHTEKDVVRLLSLPRYAEEAQRKPMTNADRIRAMDDAELSFVIMCPREIADDWACEVGVPCM